MVYVLTRRPQQIKQVGRVLEPGDPRQGWEDRRAARMAAIKTLNPKAEVARAAQALSINISGARGIQDVLKTNLGPKGTMKM